MISDTFTSPICDSALLVAALQGGVCLLPDGFGVVSWYYGIPGDSAEGEAYCVCLGEDVSLELGERCWEGMGNREGEESEVME